MKHRYLPLNIYKAELFLFLANVIWGGTFVAVKYALNVFTPYQLLFLRNLICTFFFFILFHKKIFQTRSYEFKIGIGLGLALFIGFCFQTEGLLHTSIARSSFLTESLVVFTPLFQVFLLKKRISKLELFSIVIVLIGMYLISKPDFNPQKTILNKGDLFTLIGAFFFSMYIVGLDYFQNTNKALILFYQNFLGVVILFFILFFQNNFTSILSIENYTLPIVGVLLYLSLLGNGLALFLQLYFQPMTTPARAGILFAGEPVMACIFGYFLLHEHMDKQEILGSVIILFGVIFPYLVQFIFFKNKPLSPTPP